MIENNVRRSFLCMSVKKRVSHEKNTRNAISQQNLMSSENLNILLLRYALNDSMYRGLAIRNIRSEKTPNLTSITICLRNTLFLFRLLDAIIRDQTRSKIAIE